MRHSRRNEFVNNPTLFEKKAKYFTNKYAGPYTKLKQNNFSNGLDLKKKKKNM